MVKSMISPKTMDTGMPVKKEVLPTWLHRVNAGIKLPCTTIRNKRGRKEDNAEDTREEAPGQVIWR
jgi:hypothetical protein